MTTRPWLAITSLVRTLLSMTTASSPMPGTPQFNNAVIYVVENPVYEVSEIYTIYDE